MFSSFLVGKLDLSFFPYCNKHKTWQKTVKASNLTKKNVESCARKKNYTCSMVTLIPF